MRIACPASGPRRRALSLTATGGLYCWSEAASTAILSWSVDILFKLKGGFCLRCRHGHRHGGVLQWKRLATLPRDQFEVALPMSASRRLRTDTGVAFAQIAAVPGPLPSSSGLLDALIFAFSVSDAAAVIFALQVLIALVAPTGRGRRCCSTGSSRCYGWAKVPCRERHPPPAERAVTPSLISARPRFLWRKPEFCL
jgi:hypothetical protein